jgi:hypothetical protein
VAQVLAGNAEQVVSFVDPEARWGATSDTTFFLGSKVHLSLDPDSQLSSDVETVPGNTHEAVAVAGVRERERPGLEEGALSIGDGLEGTAGTAAAGEQAPLPPCVAGQRWKRGIDTFEDDPARDQVRWVAGHASLGAIRQEQGTLDSFSTQACGPCPRRRQGLAPSEVRRRGASGMATGPSSWRGKRAARGARRSPGIATRSSRSPPSARTGMAWAGPATGAGSTCTARPSWPRSWPMRSGS